MEEIVFKNVSYQLNSKPYLEKINVKINNAKITGIIGDNKTKFIELVDALILPTYGEIIIDNDMISKENIKDMQKKVSLIKQNSHEQFFTDIIKDEMLFLVKRLNYKNKDINKKILDSLKIVGLDEKYLDKTISSLSAGELKLIQIAVSLLCNPKIIIFDEPFVELDNNNRKKIIRLIKLLKNRYDKTIIIASNNCNLLYELTDDLIVINKTKVVAADETVKIFQDIDFLNHYKLEIPNLVKFTFLAKNKKVKLSYHRDILDLIKDVYKHV